MYGSRDVTFTPSAPAGLVTLADAKAFLGVSGGAEDARITSLIVTATATVEAFCNSLFSSRTVTEILDTDDAHTQLVMRHSPVTALTSVSYAGELKTLADFVLRSGIGSVRRKESALFEPGEWTLVYAAGYTSGTAPAPVIEAVKMLVRTLYTSKGGAGFGVTREAVDEIGSVDYGVAAGAQRNGVTLPIEIAALLSPFVSEFAP